MIMWLLMLSAVFALDVYSLENKSVPFFENEIINLQLGSYGEYGVVIKDGKVLEIKEGFFSKPTARIYISDSALQYFEELFQQDLPNIEKKEKAIKYVKEHLDKEIIVEFYGWTGIFKMILLKLYLVVV